MRGRKPNPPDPFAPDAPFGPFALLAPFGVPELPPKKWTGIKGAGTTSLHHEHSRCSGMKKTRNWNRSIPFRLIGTSTVDRGVHTRSFFAPAAVMAQAGARGKL